MALNIEYETSITLDIDWMKLITKVTEAVIDYENCPYETEVSVILTDDEAIQEINKKQRDIDKPTDVLSFPFVDFEQASNFDGFEKKADCFHPDSGELMLGDIVVSVEKVKEQAKEYGHSLERELGFLIAHSMLHLFGYDHIDDSEAKIMEQKQKAILDSIELKR